MSGPADLSAADLPALLELNNAHAAELSWLEPERLRTLVARAWRAPCIGELDAFMLAFDETADYDSLNYLWFRARYPRFVYVDRLAVAPAARGRGLARELYEDVAAAAAATGHERLVCEVNVVPPNPASMALHAALGFAAVGEGETLSGRTVRYLSRPVALVPSSRQPAGAALR